MIRRIYRSTFIVVLTTLFLCVVLFAGTLYGYFENRMFGMLEQSASYIESALENQGLSYLESLPQGGDRVTLISSAGIVLYDNYADPASMEDHSDREEIILAREQGQGRSARESATLGQKTLYYAKLLSDGSVLRLSAAQQSVSALVKGMIRPMILIAAIALGLSAVLALKLSERIVEPINSIDPEHPEKGEIYPELTPLLKKLRDQNKTIGTQMDQLKQKQREFEMITRHMSEGFLVADANRKILSYNQSILELLGVEHLTQDRSLLTLNRCESFRKSVDLAIGGTRSTEVINAGGRNIRIVVDPVLEGDVLHGLVILAMDVTSQMEWEQLRREFAANVSHELKTPLTSISGIAEIMKDGMIKGDDVVHFAGHIHREAERMISLIRDTIRLSQLDEGAVDRERQEVDLYQITLEAARQLEEAAQRSGVTFEIDGGPSPILGVGPIVEEVVYNLMDNAVKYNVPDGKVSVTLSEKEKVIEMCVSDTGIGIPKEDIDRVFERFYRVDKSHSGTVAGTGLGLSIVKHGAALHGAEVRIDSKPGQGTRVTVLWPRPE
ncbi:MAG: ATP-binding protein [Eubacteriales bacterium]|nr:ATP-binding protein [Eubacteriales bacterium]MDD3290203.1 ATP-binding protein [Eubacteriales bacterium]